jgi:hypothetical protein
MYLHRSAAEWLPLINLQCSFQLRLVFLDHLRHDGRDDDLQHRAALRRAGVHDARVVRGDLAQRLRGAVHGGDLLGVPDLRRALLLERQARRQGMGSPRFLGHWMVRSAWNFPITLTNILSFWCMCT